MCSCLWVGAGPCQGHSLEGAALGWILATQPCAGAQNPTVNKADMALSLLDVIVRRRRQTSRLIVK